ncbi:MAG: hypothetical protein RLZ96_63, partial [Actinomycetota bacterium]
ELSGKLGRCVVLLGSGDPAIPKLLHRFKISVISNETFCSFVT